MKMDLRYNVGLNYMRNIASIFIIILVIAK